MRHVNRRQFLGTALAASGISLIPAPLLSQKTESELLGIARRELGRVGHRIWLRDTVGIADFSRPSTEPRFFLVDMMQGKIKSFLVSHGRGSDPEHDGWLKSFSNVPESNATSRGAYITHTWYDGRHGTSMRLSGLDEDNNNAESRAIVVHGAAYANPDMIEKFGKLGRSEGCFALPVDNLMEVLARLGPGRLLFSDRV